MDYIKKYELYQEKIIDKKGETPSIIYFRPILKLCNSAVIVFAGGGYVERCSYEGEAYAEYLASLGISAFVVNYRVKDDYFPKSLIDARTAIRFVRSKSLEFGIDKDKIIVMGSSAGGHLAALVSTYRGPLNNEPIYNSEDYIPNGQILCYPVISSDESISHKDSYLNLLGENYEKDKEKVSPEIIADNKTPKAFIFHTFEDELVDVRNSLVYANKLKELNVPCEMHIFQNGPHGVNLANNIWNVGKWKELLINWLKLNNFYI